MRQLLGRRCKTCCEINDLMKKNLLFLAAALLALSGSLNAKVPVIGISAYTADESCKADLTYIKCIQAAGAIPIVIPMTSDESQLEQVLTLVDGVIMTGGEDFDPYRCYGEEPLKEMRITNPDRDDFDIKLVRAAVAKGVPVLGICRGEQLLGVAFGGALWQDIPTQVEGSVKHNQIPTNPKYPTHSIKIEKGSILYGLFGEESMLVNSFHHQAIKKMPGGLKATARAADGIVEAVERDGSRIAGFKDEGGFIFGVQFHPEIMFAVGGNSKFLKIFEMFVEEARKYSVK